MQKNPHTSTKAINKFAITVNTFHTYPITLPIYKSSQFTTKILPQVQKAGARHDHEEGTDQNTTGQGQQPVSGKTTTQALLFVNEQQAKLSSFTHFRGWSGSEAKCGPMKFLSIIIVHDRIPPN